MTSITALISYVDVINIDFWAGLVHFLTVKVLKVTVGVANFVAKILEMFW